MTTILEKFKLKPVVAYTVGDLPDVDFKIESDHLVGIEVEVENVLEFKSSWPKNTVWNMIEDGSLRNAGKEFVSKPIKASEAPKALNQLLNIVLSKECCHFSPRTSVHVHLNVQDMEVHQVIDLVLVYMIFERLFYKFAGRGRAQNIFCVPITSTSLPGQFAEYGLGKRWQKYTGLNLLPISSGHREEDRGQGTVEFRQMHGTFKVEKLCAWIDIITRLKEYILKTPTKDIRGIISSMNDDFDFEKWLYEIFNTRAASFKYKDIEEVRLGYYAAKFALASTKVNSRLNQSASKDAPFYLFKG